MTIGQLQSWATAHSEVLLSSDHELRFPRKDRKELALNSNVLVINRDDPFPHYILDWLGTEERWPESPIVGTLNDAPLHKNTVKARIVETLADAWETSMDEVLKASSKLGKGSQKTKVVGKRGDEEVKADVEIIKRPTARQLTGR